MPTPQPPAGPTWPEGAPDPDAAPVDVSVVVPTYNRAESLRVALASLVAQEVAPAVRVEVVVVSDGSTDHTRAVAAEAARGPTPVRLIEVSNGGVASARNVGVHESRGRWIAFCDDDQIAEPGWLAALLEVAHAAGAVCVGGPRALEFSFGAPPVLGPRARALLGEEHLGDHVRAYPRDVLPNTGNALVRRDALVSAGAFDLSFRQGGEDTELFFRLRERGATPWYAPAARVRHVIPAARVTPEFLRWVARRIGVASARIDRKHSRGRGRAARAAWRASLCLTRDVPALLAASLARRHGARTDATCALAYNAGYLRGTLSLLAPGVFPQTLYLQGVDFGGHGGERSLSS